MPDEKNKDDVLETPPEPKKMVTVPLEFVEKAIKFIEMVPTLTKQIERLESTADKSQLANYDMRNAQEIVRKVLVNTFDGKIILSWKMTKDVVEKDSQGRWYEQQRIEILLDGGSPDAMPETKEMPYNPDFVHKRKQVQADVVSMFTTPEQKNMVRVRIHDREIDLGTQFVN